MFLSIKQENINNQLVQCVDARELHNFLEVGRDFSNWFKYRINSYNFIKNIDYISLAKSGEQDWGGNNRIDYHITLDMAKQLCMVENNKKGREARLYFIECERKVAQQNRIASNSVITSGDLRAIANRMDQLEIVVVSQKEQIKTLEPKADFYDTVTQTDEWLEMADVAKLLGGIGRNKIFELLRQKQVVIRGTTRPYQRYVDLGYFKLVESKYTVRYGVDKVRLKMVVSQLGIDFIRRLLARDNADNVIIKEINHERKERKHSKESLPGAGDNRQRTNEKVRSTRKYFKKLEIWQSSKDGKSIVRYDDRKQRKRESNRSIKNIQRYLKKLKISKITYFFNKFSLNYKKKLDILVKLLYNIPILNKITYLGGIYE